MPFSYNGTLGGEGSGSIPDPSVYGGRQLAVVKPSTAHLPSNPADLVKNNYVIVDRNLDDSVFPFTIDSVTFLSKYDSAIYNGRQWELQSGIQNTISVRVVDSTNESLSGNATTQQEANIEFTNEIKDLKTRSFRTIGYCGTTQPLQAREDDIFYQTNATSSYGSDLPTNFPIQVYKWNNGAWTANTENWTPDVNDVIINININPPIAFVWQNGWSPTTQGLSKTDNITIDRNNNGELQIKNGGVRFDNINSGSIANGLENDNKKLVKADDLYDKAIVGSNLQLETTSLGDTNLVLNLNNSDGAPVASQKLLKQGSDYTTLSDTDKLSYLNITTQELKDVALSAVNTYIQSKLTGAISPVLTNNLTANRAVITNTSGKLAVADAVTAKTNTNLAGVSYNAQGLITGKGTEYSVQTSMPSSPTNSQLLTALGVKNAISSSGVAMEKLTLTLSNLAYPNLMTVTRIVGCQISVGSTHFVDFEILIRWSSGTFATSQTFDMFTISGLPARNYTPSYVMGTVYAVNYTTSNVFSSFSGGLGVFDILSNGLCKYIHNPYQSWTFSSKYWYTLFKGSYIIV